MGPDEQVLKVYLGVREDVLPLFLKALPSLFISGTTPSRDSDGLF